MAAADDAGNAPWQEPSDEEEDERRVSLNLLPEIIVDQEDIPAPRTPLEGGPIQQRPVLAAATCGDLPSMTQTREAPTVDVQRRCFANFRATMHDQVTSRDFMSLRGGSSQQAAPVRNKRAYVAQRTQRLQDESPDVFEQEVLPQLDLIDADITAPYRATTMPAIPEINRDTFLSHRQDDFQNFLNDLTNDALPDIEEPEMLDDDVQFGQWQAPDDDSFLQDSACSSIMSNVNGGSELAAAAPLALF